MLTTQIKMMFSKSFLEWCSVGSRRLCLVGSRCSHGYFFGLFCLNCSRSIYGMTHLISLPSLWAFFIGVLVLLEVVWVFYVRPCFLSIGLDDGTPLQLEIFLYWFCEFPICIGFWCHVFLVFFCSFWHFCLRSKNGIC